MCRQSISLIAKVRTFFLEPSLSLEPSSILLVGATCPSPRPSTLDPRQVGDEVDVDGKLVFEPQLPPPPRDEEEEAR